MSGWVVVSRDVSQRDAALAVGPFDAEIDAEDFRTLLARTTAGVPVVLRLHTPSAIELGVGFVMAGDERRAEIEAVRDEIESVLGVSTSHEQAGAILDRVRDARGDDERDTASETRDAG